MQCVRNRFTARASAAALGLLLGLSALSAGAGQLYRWVDDQGQVHYGDQIPPNETKKGGAVLSNTGREVRTLKRQKTQDEITAEEKAAREQAEAERQRQRQEERDRVLLQTFTSEQDILDARDRKLAAVEGSIRLTQGRLDTLKKSLAAKRKEAADTERSGRVVSEALSNAITTLEGQVAENEHFLVGKHQEIDNLKQQYGADLERYRELTTRKKKDDDGTPER